MSTFTTPKPITASLGTGGARVHVTAGERSDTVVLVEPIDPANKSHVKVAEKTTVEFTDGTLAVKTVKSGDRHGSVAITVELPAGSRLVLNSAWTELDARGVLGDCELHMASGRVRLDRVAALRGSLAAGEVAVGHVAGTVDITGGAADVRIDEVDGVVRYDGSAGTVRLGHARSDVDLNGSSGSFDIDRADGGVTARAAACPIRIGAMTNGHADLTNASGGIQIGIGAGATASVDADSTKGTVRDSLPTHAESGATVTVHARTRLDDIVIHPA